MGISGQHNNIFTNRMGSKPQLGKLTSGTKPQTNSLSGHGGSSVFEKFLGTPIYFQSSQSSGSSGYFSQNTGRIKDTSIFSSAGRATSTAYRQEQNAQKSEENMQSLQQTINTYNSMYGLNLDASQIAQNYDANGNGLLSSKELTKAQNALSTMVSSQSSALSSSSTSSSGTSGLEGTLSSLTSGLGSLVGSSDSSQSSSSGNILSQASSYISKLFG